jgi:nitroimidazol reductase NimA-like FMN-containing flavoprotein (pyridoxamine 5'-phosphate oxidase superfamily)
MTPSPRRPEAGAVLAQLDRTTCLARLGTQPFGRLVFTHRALPDVLPVNYRLDGESLLIQLRSRSAAAAGTRDSVVAFDVDDIDIATRSGWSVTVVGHAHEITDPSELRQAQSLDLVPGPVTYVTISSASAWSE